ncbi:MAG: hypothetical protein HKO01_09945 [Flaviramulus sp.]|nr:hypothetical protein [Flaviramulus sp.]NNC50845.1 hypothetical protein [Flaviramulus sp.]
MRKLLIFFVLLLLGLLVYNYINKDHRNIATEQTVLVVSSANINEEFSKNSVDSKKRYIDKTIEVFGLISEINSYDITLDNKVFCLFSLEIKDSLKENIKVKVKGRVIGYDDLLEQVKLDQCTLIRE